MGNDSNIETDESLEKLYRLFIAKSTELLLFYYWADEFYKEAAREVGGQFQRMQFAKEHAVERWWHLLTTAQGEPPSRLLEITMDEVENTWDRALHQTGTIWQDLRMIRGDLLCRVALVYVLGLFEAFLTDSAALLLSTTQMRHFNGCAFKNQLSYLQQKLDVWVDESQVQLRLADIDEAFARRNLLLHRGGVVDRKYLDRVGYSTLEEGEQVTVDEHYLTSTAYSFQRLAAYLCAKFKAKKEGNYGTNH